MQILKKTRLYSFNKAREMGQERIINELEKKGLVGRGGAAFLTAKKWRLARDTISDVKYVICNADEGEPGTFKDRFILTNNIETMIEGILIAAYSIGARQCFIYLRGEYDFLRNDIQEKIDKVIKEAKTDIIIDIVRGAGAYVCGEETAIIQSIMGFRGHSMYKPPYPTIEGLWGKPTVVNNVETLTCAAQALLYDDWNPNLRLFSVSGNVSKPGVYELPLGVRMREIVDLAEPQKKIKAMSFGCFGGIMPIDYDMPITYEALSRGNVFHGAFSIILISEEHNIIDICLSIARFYTYESCGKCTPCREGTIRMLNILKSIRRGKGTLEDLKTINDFADHVQQTSLCGLGQTSGQHIISALKNFREDFEVYINEN